MACPLGATAGFLEVTGPITPTQIKAVEVNGTSLIFQFAPRTTPPTMVGNHIEEDPQNTVLYKGIRYGLIDVQINDQTQRGFTLAPGLVAFEVNLTFATTQAPPTYPSMVVLAVPVFAAKEEYHNGYFGQLVDTDLPAASIQTLFFDNEKDTLATSFSYQTCIELIGTGEGGEGGSVNSFGARVFVFPMGAAMSPQDAANLSNTFASQSGGVLPPYQLPVGFRGTAQTMLSFKVDEEGEKIPTELSDLGQISVMPISPVSDIFKNTVQFFKKPPMISGGFSDKQCPYYTTSQYKCVPFNALSDLSGNQVVLSGQSLAQVVAQQQSVVSQGIASIETLKTVGRVALIILGCVLGLLIILPFLGSVMAWLFQTPPATADAMGAAGTTARAGIGLTGAPVTAPTAATATVAATVATAAATTATPAQSVLGRAGGFLRGMFAVPPPGGGTPAPPVTAPAPPVTRAGTGASGAGASSAAGTGLTTTVTPPAAATTAASNPLLDEMASAAIASNAAKLKQMIKTLPASLQPDLKTLIAERSAATDTQRDALIASNPTDTYLAQLLTTARVAYENAKTALGAATPATRDTALATYRSAADRYGSIQRAMKPSLSGKSSKP